MQDKILPNCNNWAVWKGKEIEGETSLGMDTLFVRREFNTKDLNDLKILSFFNRVWFTRDFKDFDTIRKVISMDKEVALEVRYQDLDLLPQDIFQAAQLYVVLDKFLPAGSHIKTGESFQEYMGVLKAPTFQMSDYNQDIAIKL